MAFKYAYFVAIAFCIFVGTKSSSIENPHHFDPAFKQQEAMTNFVKQLLAERFAGMQPTDRNTNDCFAAHNEKQTVITNKYNEDFNVCERTAEEARKELSEESAEKREETLARGENICEELSSCEVHNDGRDFFQCYSKASSKNTEPLYQISSDTNKEVTNLNAQYSRIASDEKLCTGDALEDYVNSMTKANKELQSCLKNPEQPTPDPSTTTTEEPTTTTTEEPTTTTTDEPTTTTTEEPTTTTTDEPTTTTTEEPTTTTTDEPTTTTTEEPTTTTTEEPTTTTTDEPTTTTTEEPTTTTTEEPTTTTGETTTTTDEPTTTTTEEPTTTTTEEPTTTTGETTTTTDEPTTTTTDEPTTTTTEEPTTTTTDEPTTTTGETTTTTEPPPEEDLDSIRNYRRFNLFSRSLGA